MLVHGFLGVLAKLSFVGKSLKGLARSCWVESRFGRWSNVSVRLRAQCSSM